MKILTICRGGQVRSVALKYLLHYSNYGQHDVLACGVESNTQETREMLYEWADIIIVMTPEFAKFVPEKYHTKWVLTPNSTRGYKDGAEERRLYCFNVGEDRFMNPFHPELQAMLKHMIEKSGLFQKPSCDTSPPKAYPV